MWKYVYTGLIIRKLPEVREVIGVIYISAAVCYCRKIAWKLFKTAESCKERCMNDNFF